MSIILKGIDKSKYTRTFQIYPSGVVMEIIDGKIDNESPYKAIQIPKDHGRLIDADLLKDTVRDSVPAYTIGVKIPTFGDTQIMSAIDVMPTILEAEE